MLQERPLMPICDACHRKLGDVFVVEDGSTLCAWCLETGVNDTVPLDERPRMLLVIDCDDVIAS